LIPAHARRRERGVGMPGPQADAIGSNGAGENATSDEIARSLGSVWQRFSGQRPKSTTVEIDRDVIRCVIEEKPPEERDDEDGETPTDAHMSPRRFDYNATAAITRVTGRRVVAFIPKRDKKTQTSTQTFILDRPRAKF
jgi:hypothetical protein